jgi:hypothetical protein
MFRPQRSAASLLLLLVWAWPACRARAEAPHSQLYYLVDVRAAAGARTASALYLAATESELDLDLARVNADEMVRLAGELSVWVERIAATPAAEAAQIADPIVEERARVASAEKRSAELRDWIAAAASVEGRSDADSLAPPSAGLGVKIAARAAELYYDFAIIQRQEKIAEAILRVPTPREPPVPPGGPIPAR